MACKFTFWESLVQRQQQRDHNFDICFCYNVFLRYLKGCVRYIFASLFLSIKESFREIRKNVFYFTSKALLVLEKNQSLEF